METEAAKAPRTGMKKTVVVAVPRAQKRPDRSKNRLPRRLPRQFQGRSGARAMDPGEVKGFAQCFFEDRKQIVAERGK